MIVAPALLSPPERLLWFHGCRRPEHIDLEGIACDRGARVVYRRLDGCAARLLTDGEQAVISIQASDNEGRQRFSLAHELAHWINDARRGFSCFGDDMGPPNAEAASVEAAANVFSGQLLLPAYLVAPWMRGRRINLALAVELSAAFRTSVTAAAIELAKRAASGACLVCHSSQGRRWFVRSASWPSGLYPRTRLHPDTAAFDLAFKGAGSMSSPGTSPSNHWLSGAGVPALPVEAQSMRLPDGTVLTMLVLTPFAAVRTPGKRSGCVLGAWSALSASPGAPRPLES